MRCSAVVLTQMLYNESKHLCVISANATYQVLLKTLRNQRQIHTLATQLSKSQADFIVNSYLASTRHPYSYLILDFKSSQSGYYIIYFNLQEKCSKIFCNNSSYIIIISLSMILICIQFISIVWKLELSIGLRILGNIRILE